MQRREFLKMAGLGILAFPRLGKSADAGFQALEKSKPNIVFILADDIGYGDLSCYGAKRVQTPVLDRLAREGRRFTDAHSPASTCSPSRRALLTGAYSWRQQGGSAIMAGDAALSIKPGSVTLPAMLKQAGYTTGIVGKWHLGLGNESGPDWNDGIKPGPLEVGFDYAFFFPATGDRVPCVFIENHNVVGLDPNDPIAVSYAHKIGNEPTGKENPALLKLKHSHGHDNTIINGIGRIGWMSGGQSARWKDEDIADTFRQKACTFIEQNKDKPFFLYLATHNIHVPRAPNPRHHGQSQCGTRGDSIVELDVAVGEVLATLERLKLTDHTLVVFSSDNGGIMDDGYHDVSGSGYDDAVCFSHPCNGVLRGYKGSLWEGGHRVPLIARWPGHIPPGSECTELVTLLDMTASFAALTGQTLPRDAAPDSCNVLPALLGLPHDKPGRDTFIAHNGGTKGPMAIRQRNWKLIQAGGARPSYADANKTDHAKAAPPPPFLVNLADDLSETKNLADEYPDKVKELQALFERQRDAERSRP
ncbi:MAG: arylsulfatase [Verrucomicrobia bacterium]|nr:MAG: arylsulfatase [Verrucomicrobiota bacterium]